MPRYNRYGDDDGSGSELLATIFAGISIVPLAMIFAVLPAWMVMLALGAAHDQWSAIPALGYWTTYVLLLGGGIVVAQLRKVA